MWMHMASRGGGAGEDEVREDCAIIVEEKSGSRCDLRGSLPGH